MKEPTRPIPQPTVDRDGSLVAHTVATPTAFKVRARVTIGSRKVIPVIFVPGMMGSNLRARRDATVRKDALLTPGESAWRPPNGSVEGYREAAKWESRSPSVRQRILDPNALEVDPGGALDLPFCPLESSVMRERGWGEVHASSYGALLVDLQRHLDRTFQVSPYGVRQVRHYWKRVMQCEPERWGVRTIDNVTESELEKYSAYQYPVYAFGYNWLESCEIAARQLRKRIDEIKQYWIERKHTCNQVILLTHSMGGLVARACAKLSSAGGAGAADIAGIVHAVMPALGAPVAYRRIAYGTEGGNFTNGLADNIKASKFAQIAGETSAETTPVMAISPGVLQLLPNHLYPRPWLLVKTVRSANHREQVRDHLALPDGNPYDFYRDMASWFRMIDPDLADPANRHADAPGGVVRLIRASIDEAERFHTKFLVAGNGAKGGIEPYYHPRTYAFYGADKTFKAFGQIQWVAREPYSSRVALTTGNIRAAKAVAANVGGMREVEVENGLRLQFSIWPQDAHGDETVPVQSGAGPQQYARQVFAMGGFRHQDSFQNDDMLLLTRHLIVKIVQEIK